MIEHEATSRGCAVILLTHQEDPALQLKQLATLKRYRADGIVLTAAPESSFATLQSELAGLPLVALDRPLWDEVDSVILKNREAACEATTHLLEHGHTLIACVTGVPEVYSFQERISGYREAMRARCMQDQLVVAKDYDQLRTAVRNVLTSDRRPTALFTLSNMATFSALTAIKELQLAPKREPALIGFDDVGYADLVSPTITTVRQPTDMLARHAVNLLFRRILNEGNGRVEHISLAGELRYRRSCGCVC
jgi:LacI family transcriptional regulator